MVHDSESDLCIALAPGGIFSSGFSRIFIFKSLLQWLCENVGKIKEIEPKEVSLSYYTVVRP